MITPFPSPRFLRFSRCSLAPHSLLDDCNAGTTGGTGGAIVIQGNGQAGPGIQVGIVDTVISSSSAQNGGGIAVSNATIYIEGSSLTNCTAGNPNSADALVTSTLLGVGGAMVVTQVSTLEMVNSDVSD